MEYFRSNSRINSLIMNIHQIMLGLLSLEVENIVSRELPLISIESETKKQSYA
jgi:hypothetical protein